MRREKIEFKDRYFIPSNLDAVLCGLLRSHEAFEEESRGELYSWEYKTWPVKLNMFGVEALTE